MEVIILESAEEVAKRSAAIVCQAINSYVTTVLGLATGSTPVALYKELIESYRSGSVSFKHTRTFNLDEYVGLAGDHPQSYRHFMNEQLFDHIDIDKELTHVPEGDHENPMKAGPEYEKLICQAGGIDLQILGIGTNGHIGFNEPTSSLGSRTRVKELTPSTIKDNSRFFKDGESQPDAGLTMGIATILDAHRILLLATGEHKADPVAECIEGPIAAISPASALQMHTNTTIIIDEAAASKLKLQEYYRHVLKNQDMMTARFGDPRVK